MITGKYKKLPVLWSMSYKALLYHSLLGIFVYLFHHQWNKIDFDLPSGVLSSMGLAISIFLGFRVRASYDRWWEARIIWGGVINYSRSFGRQVLTLLDSTPEKKKELIYRHMAWVYALGQNLRKLDFDNETKQFLSNSDIDLLDTSKNAPTQLMLKQGLELKSEFDKGNLSEYRLTQIDATLNEFYNLQGKSERIKNTPFPREINFLAGLFALIFTTLIPFNVVAELGIATIPLTIVEGFIFYIIENIAAKYDDPFENAIRDTPVSAIGKSIEIDLRQMLGEKNLPYPNVPKKGFLF